MKWYHLLQLMEVLSQPLLLGLYLWVTQAVNQAIKKIANSFCGGEKNKRKHSTKITDTVMLSRLIYKKSFWCEMSPWWEALKWQQWSLRHRDYVVWEHISNWWVKGILIIFKPGDSFSVQNPSSIYFFHCCVTETVLPKASPPLSCPLPQNSCHKYFVIYSKGNKECFLKRHVHSSVYFILFTMLSATSEWTWIQ